jgi:anhydro-N-acetylmuramic acid kinase
MTSPSLYIGLMSGTSLDGVDGVLTSFDAAPVAAYVPFPDELKRELLALQAATDNEIHREALAANQLARLYAECVQRLLEQADIAPAAVTAIGAHGQTIRHLPAQGYTRQINNPALLAELTRIDVVADFRSRDIAAGGQGAPLVPAFHQAVFGSEQAVRVVANIGGIGNISLLRTDGSVSGYDTGPGNLLMDAWVHKHTGKPYDANGSWAASGKILPALLERLLQEPYLALPAPKSTGRDLFHADWLAKQLPGFEAADAADVQATLAAFTARTIAAAVQRDAPDAEAVYVCGGGALNEHLMLMLQQALMMPVLRTDELGIAAMHVEALAFAWLAMRFGQRLAGNLPAVTGAAGPRILGALYPA